jgi:hypothetical protein
MHTLSTYADMVMVRQFVISVVPNIILLRKNSLYLGYYKGKVPSLSYTAQR